MMNKKLIILIAATLLSSTAFAEQIQLTFEGVVNNDPNEPFTLVVEYSSDAQDFTPGQECCGKYGPMSLEITHGSETLSIGNAAFNIDVIPGEGFEGIAWVDDGQPWSGTLTDFGVTTGGINFGRAFSGTMTKDLPLTVDLAEWGYSNGCFDLTNGGQTCLDLQVQVFSASEEIEFAVEDLQSIVDANPGTPIADKVDDVISKSAVALYELGKTPPDIQAAVGNLEGAVGDLEAALNEGLDPGAAINLMNELAGAARLLAQTALNDAIDADGKNSEIMEAEWALAEGDLLIDDGFFKDAVAQYKDAVSKAESAIN